MEEPAQVKRCSKCGIEKAVAGFSSSKTEKDGLHGQCKECHAERYAKPENKKRKTEWLQQVREHPEFVDIPLLIISKVLSLN